MAARQQHGGSAAGRLSSIEMALLDDYQRDFPLDSRPYARIAADLEVSEAEVLDAYARLKARGLVSRIGAVVRPHRLGWSTLAAMSVPEERLEAVAALVSAYPEVNHNYEREHTLNLWFVVTGRGREDVLRVLADMVARTNLEVVELPLEEAYRVDLGFSIR